MLLWALLPSPKFEPNLEESDKNVQGIWMTNVGASVLHHTLTLDNALYNLADSGYNQIYVSTYGLVGTIYPSEAVKSHPIFLPPFTDVLKAVSKEGNRQSLQVYAWLEYGLMLHPTNEVAIANPEWLLQTPEGETIVNDFVWLNPEHPEVQEYILQIISEVSQYNLTGIQLDDHWSVPIQFGNKVQAMNELTAKIRQTMKEINPDLKLSISPNPYGFSLKKYNQDWLHWAKQGYIDEVALQVYRPTSDEFAKSIQSSQIQQLPADIPVVIGIYTGSWVSLLPHEEIDKQIEITKNLNYGYSLFCWEYRIFSLISSP